MTDKILFSRKSGIIRFFSFIGVFGKGYALVAIAGIAQLSLNRGTDSTGVIFTVRTTGGTATTSAWRSIVIDSKTGLSSKSFQLERWA